jgi:gliding motility-associated-like protein
MKLINNLKYKLFLLLLIASTKLFAQAPTITPYLISSGGNAGYDIGSMNIAWSVGEPCVTTIQNGSNYITQGFHQPSGKLAMHIDSIKFANSRCKTANNGWAKVYASGGSGDFSYEWSPISSDKDSIFGLQEGTYIVTVTDDVTAEIVIDTVIIELDFDGDCDLIIYSGFSPNGDGINDKWIIDGIDLFPNNEVSIFNRYGTIVYSAQKYDNVKVVFEGNYQKNNEPLPDGTYFYIIVLTDKLSNNTYKGWVEITK